MSKPMSDSERQQMAEKLFKEGDALDDAGKQLEAIKKFEAAIALKPNYPKAYFAKAFSLCSLGRIEEGIQFYSKAIELDPTWAMAHFNKGTNLYDLNRKEEALECYNQAILHNPQHFDAHNNKANTLYDFGKYDEAIEAYNVVIAGKSDYPYAYQGKGNALYALDKKEEALQCFNKAVSLFPMHPLFQYNLGKCLHSLNKYDEALKALIDAQANMLTKVANILSRINVSYINMILSPLIELYKESQSAANLIQEANQTSPGISKVTMRVGALQEHRDKLITEILNNLENHSPDETKKRVEKLDQMKEEYKKLIISIKEELKKVPTDSKKGDISLDDLKHSLDDFKREYSKNMDEVSRKIDIELKRLDLSQDGQNKIKSYFKAFMETFDVFYVLSQINECEHLQIEDDKLKEMITSAVSPFICNWSSTNLQSLKEFLQDKDTKTDLKKIKKLASDNAGFSHFISKCIYQIITKQSKQHEIVQITNGHFVPVQGRLFENISKFYESLEEKSQTNEHGNSHKADASKLGHNDANNLIHHWLGGKIEVYEAQTMFVKLVTETDGLIPVIPGRLPQDSNRSRCCNIF